MAGWVRFADTKATILAAGLGVAVTMLANSAKPVVQALKSTTSCTTTNVLLSLCIITIGAFLWTLFWIIRAIAPRSEVPYTGLNRFAWPSLVNATADELASHTAQTAVTDDAWQQAIDLAKIAKRKFTACKFAIYGFGVVVCAGFFTVAAASWV